MRTYKLYAAGSATANAAANISIVKTGVIRGLFWSAYVQSKTDAGLYTMELSFQAVSFIAQNDTAGPIAQITACSNFVTSGLDVGSINTMVSPLAIPVNLGEKLYLNCVIGGTMSHATTCFVYIDD